MTNVYWAVIGCWDEMFRVIGAFRQFLCAYQRNRQIPVYVFIYSQFCFSILAMSSLLHLLLTCTVHVERKWVLCDAKHSLRKGRRGIFAKLKLV